MRNTVSVTTPSPLRQDPGGDGADGRALQLACRPSGYVRSLALSLVFQLLYPAAGSWECLAVGDWDGARDTLWPISPGKGVDEAVEQQVQIGADYLQRHAEFSLTVSLRSMHRGRLL